MQTGIAQHPFLACDSLAASCHGLGSVYVWALTPANPSPKAKSNPNPN